MVCKRAVWGRLLWVSVVAASLMAAGAVTLGWPATVRAATAGPAGALPGQACLNLTSAMKVHDVVVLGKPHTQYIVDLREYNACQGHQSALTRELYLVTTLSQNHLRLSLSLRASQIDGLLQLCQHFGLNCRNLDLSLNW